MTDFLPAKLHRVVAKVRGGAGRCATKGRKLTCRFTGLKPAARRYIDVIGRVRTTGVITNAARVAAEVEVPPLKRRPSDLQTTSKDLNPANDADLERTLVVATGARSCRTVQIKKGRVVLVGAPLSISCRFARSSVAQLLRGRRGPHGWCCSINDRWCERDRGRRYLIWK